MKILITGASSYVGARLFFDLKKYFEVTGTYNSNKLSKDFVKMDVTNWVETTRVIENIMPEVIIHVAANPNAKWCETNNEIAEKLNADGTKNIVNAANIVGSRIIYISSVAAIKPQNVYGKSKLAGEEYVKNTVHGYVILRPSLIIGFSPNTTNDRPFNRFLKNIDEKTPAIYDTSWKFQPTWIGNISEIIKKIIEKEIKNVTLPIIVPEIKTRFDVAKDILTPFGIEVMPRDDKDTTPTGILGQEKLRKLNLPTYTYSQIIEKIIDEIKNRNKFVL